MFINNGMAWGFVRRGLVADDDDGGAHDDEMTMFLMMIILSKLSIPFGTQIRMIFLG